MGNGKNQNTGNASHFKKGGKKSKRAPKGNGKAGKNAGTKGIKVKVSRRGDHKVGLKRKPDVLLEQLVEEVYCEGRQGFLGEDTASEDHGDGSYVGEDLGQENYLGKLKTTLENASPQNSQRLQEYHALAKRRKEINLDAQFEYSQSLSLLSTGPSETNYDFAGIT